MRTDEKIIRKAIELYNKKGFANVTSRNIAEQLKISHGNLEYHFKTKEAILDAIYTRMKTEVSGYFSDVDEAMSPFEQLDTLLKKLERFQTKYRFFNLDVIEISRKYPTLKSKIEATVQIRRDQMASFFTLFSKQGYLEPEPHTNFYLRLQHKIRMIITFWMSQEMIMKNFDPGQEITMRQTIWDLLIAHLTEKGKGEYYKLKSIKPAHLSDKSGKDQT
jgi:AcrR family transcriptional regulator